ncbi:hypothetical protein VTL71DRAFT_15368 [Oculimacula yallundae]|uniref:Uncharacterized protein n=1 Tax=Oculimacula yallundae TaxID=86028 RepID=A0ABR4CGF2_9HELO
MWPIKQAPLTFHHLHHSFVQLTISHQQDRLELAKLKPVCTARFSLTWLALSEESVNSPSNHPSSQSKHPSQASQIHSETYGPKPVDRRRFHIT